MYSDGIFWYVKSSYFSELYFINILKSTRTKKCLIYKISKMQIKNSKAVADHSLSKNYVIEDKV